MDLLIYQRIKIFQVKYIFRVIAYVVASRFGMMQIKTTLTILIRNYEFSPSPKTQPPLKLTPRLILVNCPEIWLKCSKRKWKTELN